MTSSFGCIMKEDERESSEETALLSTHSSHNDNSRDATGASVGSPDGLRSWVVTSSIFVVNFIIIGLGRVSGIFYVNFMRDFHINRRVASTPFSVQQATRNLFGPVVGILGQLFSVRALIMTGGLIGAISACGCAYAPNITWITILWGDFYGIANAFTSTINQTLINQYFVRNRSSASGVAFAGGSMGAMVFPFVVDYLIDTWGIRGTFGGMAVILILIVPVAIILKPPPWIADHEVAPTVKMDKSRKISEERFPNPGGSDVISKEKLPLTNDSSDSDQNSNGGQNRIFGDIYSEANKDGSVLFPSQLSTNPSAVPNKFFRFFVGEIKVENADTVDEGMPLNPKSNTDSKRKGKLGNIVRPIISKVKEMFIKPSTDDATDVSQVIEKPRDATSEMTFHQEEITRDCNDSRHDGDANDKGGSSVSWKKSVFTISSKLKQFFSPGKQERSSNVIPEDADGHRQQKECYQEKLFPTVKISAPYMHPSSLQTMNFKRNENLVKKETTNTEIRGESMQSLQYGIASNRGHDQSFKRDSLTSVSEIDEPSSPTSYGPAISHMASIKNEITNEDVTIVPCGISDDLRDNSSESEHGSSRLMEQAERLIRESGGTLSSVSLSEDVDSTITLTDEAREQHPIMQSDAETGLQFTIHLKKQEISGKEFLKGDQVMKEVIPSKSTKPLETLKNIQGKQLETPTQEKNEGEQIASKIILNPRSTDEVKQKRFKIQTFKDFSHPATGQKSDSSTESEENTLTNLVQIPSSKYVTIKNLSLDENSALTSISVDNSTSFARAAHEYTMLEDKIDENTNSEAKSPSYSFRDKSSSEMEIKRFPTIEHVASSEASFQMSIRSIDEEKKKTTLLRPESPTASNIYGQSNISVDMLTEVSESDFTMQRKKVMGVTGTKQKGYVVKKSQNSESYENEDRASFWPAVETRKESVAFERSPISEKIKLSDTTVSPDKSDDEGTEPCNLCVDFRILYENINYIIHIIRITESLQFERSSSPKRAQNPFSEKSEIRKALEVFLYSIEDTISVNRSQQLKSFMDIHSSNAPRSVSTFRIEKSIFGYDDKSSSPDSAIGSSFKNETSIVNFKNDYIYELLLMVFQANESIISSHFPEQDQEHILEVILEIKKLVRHCLMLESKHSNISTTSKRTAIGTYSKQMSDAKSYISIPVSSETQQSIVSIDSRNADYGSFERKDDSLPSSLKFLESETSCTFSDIQSLFEHSGENPNQNEIHKPNNVWGYLKVAAKLYTNPLFLLVCICRVVHFFTFMAVLTIIVDYGIDKGLKEEDGRYLISAMSLGDFIGRLCCGWLTDYDIISLEVFMAIAMILQGSLSIALYLVQANYLYEVAAAFAVLQGSVFIRHPVLVCKYTKDHEHSIGLGFINLSAGVLGFFLPNYIGYFRDTLGSYNELLCINGGMCIISGLMWTCAPCYLRYSST